MGKSFGGFARFVDAYFGSEDTFDEALDLVETPLKGSCDVFVHKDFPSLGYDIVLSNSLYHSYVFPHLFTPLSFSPVLS